MPAAVPVPPPAPRRARYLIPPGTPHRTKVVAVMAMLGLLAGLLLAPVALALAVACHAVSRLSRWRAWWLIAPAGAGLTWVAAVGPAAALSGFAAYPAATLALLARAPGKRAALATAGQVAGGPGRWLPGQLPVALLLAAGLAAIAWWARWMHTDEWCRPAPRPGLVSWCRCRVLTSFIRSGGVLTRDGVCLGVDLASGRPAAVSWREAERGVLVTGAGAAMAGPGFQFAHAAIRRRKAVIMADLDGDPGLAAAVRAACAAAGAPLAVFGPDGPGWYDPLRAGDAARRAALVMGLIDWGGFPQATPSRCREWLADVFAVLAAAPGEPGAATLEEVVALLRPGGLVARLAQVPVYHPRRQALAGRAQLTADRLAADPAAAEAVAGQLAALAGSPLGRWLGPGAAAGTRISVSDVVRRRGVALFTLGRATAGPGAAAIANLVAIDTRAEFAGLRRSGITADGLAWFSRCEAVDPAVLAGLAADGAQAGLAAVLSTGSPETAASLAGAVGVLVAHRLADPGLAELLAAETGLRARMTLLPVPSVPAPRLAAREPALAPAPGPAAPLAAERPARYAGLAWQPVVTAQELLTRADGEFTLVVRGERVQARARAVAGRGPGAPVPPAHPAGLR